MRGNTGERFAQALAAKDVGAVRGLLADEIEFRALTPNRNWSGSTPREVVDEIIFGRWFEPSDEIRRLVFVRTDSFAACEHAAYRLQVHNADGDFLVEQQAYFTLDDTGPIASLRVLCSGYRPDPEPHRDRLLATSVAGDRG